MKKNYEFIGLLIFFTAFYVAKAVYTKETEVEVSFPKMPAIEQFKQEYTYPQIEIESEPDYERYVKKPDPLAVNGSKFLFIGNSHTYVNNLPGTFYELASAGGYETEVYEITAGAYSLKKFSDPQDPYGEVVFDALKNEAWDFVILQENTNAAMSSNADRNMLIYARVLDELAEDASAQTAFLMTWAPEDGIALSTQEDVQEKLSQNYKKAAIQLDALLIPGGDLFVYALDRYPDLVLLGEDGQHPSVEGTYLTACAAYTLFFQETPEGNPFLYDIDGETAKNLQRTAYDYMTAE